MVQYLSLRAAFVALILVSASAQVTVSSSPSPTHEILVATPSSSASPTHEIVVATPSSTPSPTHEILVASPSSTPSSTHEILVASPSSSPSPTHEIVVASVSSSASPSHQIPSGSSSPSPTHHSPSASPTHHIEISSSPSLSPTTPAPASPSPTPALIPNLPAKDDNQGKAITVAVLPFVFVVGAGGFYIYSLRQTRSFVPRPSYVGILGGALWATTLIALACSGSVIKYSYYGVTPFETSYVQFLCATNIIVWLFLFAVITVEYTKMAVENLDTVTKVCECVFTLFLFAAGTAASTHFDGKDDFCAYNDKAQCTTYQASIFFTWIAFYLFCVKLFLDVLTKPAGSSYQEASGSRV